MAVEISLRRMTEDDIVAADQLREAAGWNQMHADWLRTLRYEPDGCFVATAGGESEIVGTVTTTTYGTALAWIGMMLVREDLRRCGIATALMNRALEYLQDCRVDCIKLDATPAGLPVYERLGFESEWTFHRWAAACGAESDSANASMFGARASEFRVYDGDHAAFGADREAWLKRLAADSVVISSDNGFGMLRRGRQADYLGPVSAAAPDVAEQLIGELLPNVSGTVFWDIPAPNEDALVMATALGFQPVRELTRMWMGAKPIDADLTRQFALSDPGMG